MSDPACRGRGRWFFAAKGEQPAMRKVRLMRARMICDTCECFDACREAGKNEPWGVWAGKTPEERGFDKDGRQRAGRRRSA